MRRPLLGLSRLLIVPALAPLSILTDYILIPGGSCLILVAPLAGVFLCLRIARGLADWRYDVAVAESGDRRTFPGRDAYVRTRVAMFFLVQALLFVVCFAIAWTLLHALLPVAPSPFP